MQKTVNCTLKGGLLQCERRHIGNALTVNKLGEHVKKP